MSSESTSAFGQPRDTKPTAGDWGDWRLVSDMFGVEVGGGGSLRVSGFRLWAVPVVGDPAAALFVDRQHANNRQGEQKQAEDDRGGQAEERLEQSETENAEHRCQLGRCPP